MILGVVLAAGTGTRFDAEQKLLADLDGRPVVVRAIDTLLQSPLDETVAVVGHRGDAVADALDGHGVDTIENVDFESGQSTSIRVGVGAARTRGADAVVFALGDMPCVSPDTVQAILETYRETNAGIVIPVADDRRGNPVLFDRRHFDALAALSGDVGGRRLFSSHAVTTVAVDDPGIHLDVDTKADLDAVRDCVGDVTEE